MSNSTCSWLHCECPGETAVDSGPDLKWILGVVFGIGGSLGTVSGMVLQKYAHNQQERGNTNYSTRGGCLCSPIWVLGLAMIILVPMPLDIGAMAFAPQSIIAPLSGVTIVLSQVVAPKALGERNPTLEEWGWSCVIFTGTALLAIVGDQCSQEYSIADIRELFPRPMFLVLEAIQLTGFGLAIAWVTFPNQMPIVSRNPKLLRPLGYAYLAGAMGGQQNFMLKEGSQNAYETTQGHMAGWDDWLTYAMMMGVVILGTLQVMALNMGLSMMEATRYLPVYNACLIVCSAITGMSFYEEYERMTPVGGVGYALAIFVIVIGVIMLATSAPSTKVVAPDGAKDADCEHGSGKSDSECDDDEPETACLIKDQFRGL